MCRFSIDENRQEDAFKIFYDYIISDLSKPRFSLSLEMNVLHVNMEITGSKLSKK